MAVALKEGTQFAEVPSRTAPITIAPAPEDLLEAASVGETLPVTSPESSATDILSQRYQVVFSRMVVTGLLSYLSYLVAFVVLGVPMMPAVNVAASALCLVAYVLVSRGHLRVATVVMGLVVVGHPIPATLIFGWSGNFHLFAFLFLVFVLLSPQLHRASKLLIATAVTTAYLALEAASHSFATPLPERTVTIFKLLNIVMFSGTLAYLVLIYSAALWKATEKLNSLNQQLTFLATTDSLTGLLNRRSMNDALQIALTRFEQRGQPFSVILGDLDNFKAVNDVHGHNVGDSVLSAAARALQSVIRPMDRLARWGGEEFLFLLPDADTAGATLVAKRIQERLRALRIPCDEKPVSVRMTLGVASVQPGQSVNALLAEADAALYSGKRQGKNRVVISEPVKQ